MFLAFASASPAADNLVQNGSFELSNPVLTKTGTYLITPTGWNGGDFLVRGQVPSGFPFYPAPQNGQQFEAIHYGAESPQTGTVPPLWQIIDVPQAGKYRLSWYDNSGSYISYRVSVSIGNSPWVAYTGVGATAWTYRNIEVNLEAGPNKLIFSGGGPGSSLFPYLDNVSLELVTPSGPPLPPSPPPPPPTGIGSEGVIQATNGVASAVWNASALSTITVGASPFNWTNTTPVNVFVLMGGGTVSALSLNGTNFPSGFLTGPLTLPLQPGQYISVSYSSAPTLFMKPF